MDLLYRAYAVGSDDDDEEPASSSKLVINPSSSSSSSNELGAPPPKRNRTEGGTFSTPTSNFTTAFHQGGRLSSGSIEPQITTSSSRYISKRERAILADQAPPQPPTLTNPPPVVGTISDSDIPCDVLALLRSQANVRAQSNKFSRRISLALEGHSKAVNSIQWSQSHDHLLASAGMDQTVYVWNVWNRQQQKARVFRYHNAAVKDVRWSPQGLSLLSCGYDSSSRLVDVEKGTETQVFGEDQVVEAIRFHPCDPNLFISGGSRGILRLWDIRAHKVVQEYQRGMGSVLDVEFRADGKHLISSSDTSRSNISENSIIVWDVSRQLPLSNQVYVEAYTCPCVRYHPSDACFIAQSNGNYIAIFSGRPPFKLDRYKRYGKHKVSGFPVKCEFSLDGKELITGSSDGYIYMYSYRTSELLRKFKAFEQPSIDVAFHPSMPNVVASCSWAGEISVFE